MYHNIPDELKALNQWVVWKLVETDDGKATKLPYNPRTGNLASTTNPQTWVSFEEACGAVWNGYSGIGFVFTAFDPYCGIDLDATDNEQDMQRQRAIYSAMESYSEFSPSGEGLHIIVKAQVPHGRKRAAIEVYSNERYFTFTGNVYNHMPIFDRQELVTALWEEMGPQATPNHYQGDAMPRAYDEEVIESCRRALNGPLFETLWAGNWQQDYSSQSEADLALMNIIVFHTKNRMQAMRIFRMSGLGQRDKAKRDKYLSYTIDKAFDETLPAIDVSGIIDQMNSAIAAARSGQPQPEQVQVVTSPYGEPGHAQPAHGATARHIDGFDLDLWRRVKPPHLMELICDYVYAVSPRPVYEISLAATIGLMAGITGRAFNVEGAGLNQYIMMLAPTGRGKEAMQVGINKIMSRVAEREFPAAWNFIGPADMASGSGLLKFLAERETPCFVSLTGEIGLRLQQMSMKGANTADLTLRRVLLDLYNKSGAGSVIRPTVYSDKKNNIDIIHSPAFTWLGESTPSEFYKGLNEDQIASGLLPRFMVIEYNGDRVPYNERHANAHPSHALVSGVYDLCDLSMKILQANSVVNVSFTHEAREKANMINAYCDFKMNSMPDGPLVQLWNRTHFKVLKVAALLAVAHNPHAPIIDTQMVDWSNSLVMTDVLTLSGRFERGEVGNADVKIAENEQVTTIRKFLRDMMSGNIHWLNPTQIMNKERGIIMYSTLTQGVGKYAAFRNDPRGASRAIAATIEEVIKIGALSKLSKAEAQTTFGIMRGDAYQITDPQWFFAV